MTHHFDSYCFVVEWYYADYWHNYIFEIQLV